MIRGLLVCGGVVVVTLGALLAYRLATSDRNDNSTGSDIPRTPPTTVALDPEVRESNIASDPERKNVIVGAQMRLAMEGLDKELALSDDQERKIKEIYVAKTTELLAMAEKHDRKGEEWKAVVRRCVEERDRAMREQLNDEQKKRFDDMIERRGGAHR